MISMDLDTPWGPEDVGEALEEVPAQMLVVLLAQMHDATHDVCRKLRRRSRWRPWLWRYLPALRRRERELCAECKRRVALVCDVHNARVEGES